MRLEFGTSYVVPDSRSLIATPAAVADLVEVGLGAEDLAGGGGVDAEAGTEGRVVVRGAGLVQERHQPVQVGVVRVFGGSVLGLASQQRAALGEDGGQQRGLAQTAARLASSSRRARRGCAGSCDMRRPRGVTEKGVSRCVFRVSGSDASAPRSASSVVAASMAVVGGGSNQGKADGWKPSMFRLSTVSAKSTRAISASWCAAAVLLKLRPEAQAVRRFATGAAGALVGGGTADVLDKEGIGAGGRHQSAECGRGRNL